MGLRREQGLLIATALLGGWMIYSAEGKLAPITVKPTVQEYAASPVPRSPLVPQGTAQGRAELFAEPSESQPLPPREHDEPPRTELPVVWLPLVPGQQPPAFRGLRGPGEVKEPVNLDPSAATPAPSPAGNPDAPVATSPGTGNDSAEWARLFDRVETVQGQMWWGEILDAKKASFPRNPPSTKFTMRWIEPKSGRVVRESMEVAPQDVKSIKLADTLRNKVAERELDLTREVSNLPYRLELIDWLLTQRGREAWVHERALQLARGYAEIAVDKIEGLRTVARVLRSGGRVADEWQLYQTLPAELADSPFRWTGQGSLEALLGLDLLAEQHLRRAAQTETDARAAMALAEFLLAHGRADEALRHAQRAYRDRNQLERAEDQNGLKWLLVSAHLAIGQLEEARNAAGNLPATATAVRGAIAYAAGDLEFATSQFRNAVETGDAPGLAALGAAACAARAGQWQDALAGFLGLADRAPLLRARALAGAGLVLERTGNYDAAATTLASALAVDPSDPYAAYLRGRVLRLAGDLDGAIEQLMQALRRRDDLVEAMAELAEAHLRLAARDPARGAESLLRAMRYADRCVQLDAKFGGKPTPRYLELQALAHWRAGELRGAREAFEAAQALGSAYGQVGLALVDYAQGRVEPAREQLLEMEKRPLNDPFRDYGRRTLAAIDDHAEKVEVRDDFERAELGGRWKVEYKGRTALRPVIERGRVMVRGKVDNQETVLRRELEQAGDFLGVEVEIERSGDDCTFAGIHLRVGRDEKNTDFQALLGFAALADGVRPALQILDGQAERASAEEQAKFQWRALDVGAAGGPQRLALEFEKDADKGFTLRAYWNGQKVAEEKITRVNRATRVPMQVDLRAEAKRQLGIAYDKFRLRLRQAR